MTDSFVDKELLINLVNDPFSNSTIRLRRNLMLASFIVLGIYYLGASLSDLHIFGLSLGSADNIKIQLLAISLLGYWLLMYSYSLSIDNGILQERRRQLSELESDLKGHINEYGQILDKHPERKQDNNMYYSEWNRLKNEQEALDAIAESIKKAQVARKYLSITETILPILMSLAAIIITVLHTITVVE